MKSKQLTKGSSLFLDLVRILSVQLVVIGHGISYLAIFPLLEPPYFPFMQNIAVVVFFILSGYLISSTVFYKLSTDLTYSFRSFFIDRFSRIFSALIPALVFILIADLVSKSLAPESYLYTNAFNVKTFFANVLMLQDFPFLKHLHLQLTSFGSARPLWTLAVEWWIYMWFGFFTIKLVKAKELTFSTLSIFLFLCIVPFYNLVAGRGNGLTLDWLFGVLIYFLYDRFKQLELQKGFKLALLCAFALLAAVRVFMTLQEYDAIFAFLLSICILIGMELCSTIHFSGNNPEKLIKFLANYAYTLYLIHYTIYDFVIIHLKNNLSPQAVFIVGFLISNVLAAIIGYFAEVRLTPFVKQQLKARFTRVGN